MWRRGGAAGGPSGGARVSGVSRGVLQRGHRRLPIAHNETALSAGSRAEGKQRVGAQPGQKEAEDRCGGGECFKRLLPASLPDSPLRLVSCRFPGLQTRGRAPPWSYVGSIHCRSPCPSCEDPEAPRPVGTDLSGSSPHLQLVRPCRGRRRDLGEGTRPGPPI